MMQNHAFFRYKNKGTSRCLRGKVLVELVFVASQANSWTQQEMDDFYASYQSAIGRLSTQAKKVRVPLSFTTMVGRHYYNGIPDDTTMSSRVLPDVCAHYVTQQGFSSYQSFAEHRKRTYQTDELTVIFVLEEQFRAFAQPDLELEYCAVTKTDNDHVIAHEMLHLFGAADLYYPYMIYGLTMRYFPETFMCTYEGMEVDELTQYLIGWTSTLSPKAKEFLMKVADYDVDKNHYALALEVWRDHEETLYKYVKPFTSFRDLQQNAAKQDPWAEYLLGLCYRDGIGVTQDLTMAEEYFARSGRAGLNIGAYAHAQMMLLRDKLTEEDKEDLWLILDYNSGNHMKLISLRLACLLTGIGGKSNTDWAVKNIVHQYENEAQFYPFAKRSAWFFRIAEKLSSMLPTLQKVVTEQRVHYDENLKNGDGDLRYLVAKMLENGKSAQQDLPGAYTLYENAAECGNYLACLELSRCCKLGIGTARDLQKAKLWMQKASACRQKHPYDPFCHILFGQNLNY